MPRATCVGSEFLMSLYDLIYFDQAATSYPKPPCVLEAVREALTDAFGNPGRSSHEAARLAAERVYEVRDAVCRFFDASSAERVVFTQNATHALNLAISSACAEGGHVLCSDLEHNAVLRPLERLAAEGKIRYNVFPSKGICAEVLEGYLQEDTRAVITTHASNICGRVLPLAELGALCRRRGILFVVDASQSAGHLPLSVRNMHIDVLCAPAHKGLYGILGAGFAIFETQREFPPFMVGGGGANAFSPFMPRELPEHFEAGSLSVPAILSLGASLAYLQERSVHSIAAHIAALEGRLHENLSVLSRVRIWEKEARGTGILSFTCEGVSPSLLAEALDEAGVAVRAGYHCAPLAHKTIGSDEVGTVRISVGATNTLGECDEFAERLNFILKR